MPQTRPIKKAALRVGTRVRYFPRDGLPKLGKIVDSGSKNGMKVYDVDLDDGDCRWGYRDQFEVIK